MIDQNVEEGIERYIKHVRKMSLLTDEQIKIIVSHIYSQNPDSVGIMGTNIEEYINKIRQMAMRSDAELRSLLRDAAAKDQALRDTFEDASQKKLLSEIKEMAKDIRGDPKKFARRVDDFSQNIDMTNI